MLEAEFEHQVHKGDATELFVLERAGIKRPPDVVVAVTGDDEDNVVICQLARDNYGVETTIARVNDPRNQPYFDLLGISPTVSATASIMGLIEHEVPGARPDPPARAAQGEPRDRRAAPSAATPLCAGKPIGKVALPEGSRLISSCATARPRSPDDTMQLEAGDSVLAILEPGKEDEFRRVLVRD